MFIRDDLDGYDFQCILLFNTYNITCQRRARNESALRLGHERM